MQIAETGDPSDLAFFVAVSEERAAYLQHATELHSPLPRAPRHALSVPGTARSFAHLLSLPQRFIDFHPLSDAFKGTVLLNAVIHNRREVVQLLIQLGATVDLGNPTTSTTPLLMAAACGHVDLARLLVDAGAKINQSPRLAGGVSITPLFMAAQLNQVEVVRYFVSTGSCDIDGGAISPLFIAAEVDNLEIVDILLEAGANPSKPLKNGIRPLFQACSTGNERVVVRMIRAGVDVNLACADHSTPLFIACQQGFVAIVRHLLQQNIARSLNARFGMGKGPTPLFIAALRDHPDIVEELIGAGADLSIRNEQVTPLMAAVWSGHARISQLLLNRGALRFENSVRAVLDLAMAQGHSEIAQNIKDAGQWYCVD